VYGLLLLAAALAGVLLSLRATRAAAQRRELIFNERLRIARDLHDVVGHGIGGITVQAGAARLALAAGAADEALRALREVESAGRDVLREVRWLVGLLREDRGDAGEHDLTELIGDARRCGLQVTLDVDGELGRAPISTAEAAYRIAQEALTNVLRHARGCPAAVRISLTDVLRLDIVDEGAGAVEASVGNGIRGMRERAAAVGGTLHSGPRPGGAGWAVQATLPLRGRTR
jgi:signal transduction histidine kinase